MASTFREIWQDAQFLGSNLAEFYFTLKFCDELKIGTIVPKYVTIATKTRRNAQNQFFCVGKNLLLHMVMPEKVSDRNFLAFWPFENEWKFRKSVKCGKKSEIWQKVNII